MAEYRIEYVIQRAEDDSDEFVEIGFGSSATWSSVDSALYAVESDIQNRNWETEPGQPDPSEVDAEAVVGGESE